MRLGNCKAAKEFLGEAENFGLLHPPHRHWSHCRISLAIRFLAKLVRAGETATPARKPEVDGPTAIRKRRAPSALGCLARLAAVLVVGGVVAGTPSNLAAQTAGANTAAKAAAKIPSQTCLTCHGHKGFAVKEPNGKMRSLFVDAKKFEHSIHGSRQCVDCHTNITRVPHPPTQIRVSCVTCHESLWAKAQEEGKAQQFALLGYVVQRINSFMGTIHARPSRQDQSRTNATCYNCHQAHYIYPPGTPVWTQWRLNLPYICGKCHSKELAAYATSVHGRQVLQKHNLRAAICSDCHTSHHIQNPFLDSTRLVIIKNCGACHQEEFHSYLDTYHGQVSELGYAYTAACWNCHGHHRIQRVDDPRSSVFPTHRLATCQQCHVDATPGFLSFQPHANTHNFGRYPYLWIASHFMAGLLVAVFAFFWTHSALWFYRSYKERKARGEHQEKLYVYPLPQPAPSYFQRFSLIARLGHLLLLLSTMTLVFTGMTALYANTGWAHVVVKLLGGARMRSTVHHIAAGVFLAVFFVHVVAMTVRLGWRRHAFNWFGPDSLVPRWQDLRDILAMFKWFFGRGPRPTFERWTYWEKFDYWAVFWGVCIIGGSGAIIWDKVEVAKFLPGYVFNVALVFHREEAVLAAVFLFTVHFFNNHFRPDKFPLDTTMFTGAMTREEFEREHALEYQRLVETGKLESHRVPAPSPAMALGSRILGFTLITIGLALLVLVAIGFIGHAAGT